MYDENNETMTSLWVNLRMTIVCGWEIKGNIKDDKNLGQ